MDFLLVGLGGAAGSILRYTAALIFGGGALTTFGVNMLGSFLIGLLLASDPTQRSRLLLGVGGLGGFTTFSAWQFEAFAAGRLQVLPRTAAMILFGSVAVGFIACWIGYALGERLKQG